ncbi:hypothetical protein PR202_gb02254 [Eleusine coracana subsp. coracana]|uniref:Probable zinc-ribbon domain-containing protein n=1 Tax=Eleusine coracana subsp. coracana TaxID=191504 RepID=A0AAV5DYP7_ELECO|nr:hypothetical protein PR202_gb02254 [Eleusine coracana subsp. coracana]
MATQPKEMKYRRRARAPEQSEYGQCSERSSGALDWGALKQDPVELLRKLDELRDQITRSCELTAQPPERHRMSRRAISLRPSHAEPPPTGRQPEYIRSRFAGRHGTSMPLTPYDQVHRLGRDERYTRQSSGRFRQNPYPEGQWESSGFGQGSRHHSSCQCSQCLQGQRGMAPEEHILMAKYFAGQQGSFRYDYDRSQSVSSELDRRSSSLYSHRSMSKRRAEYFRKKAGSFCRPVKGAAPFVVCSSCCQLLQLPSGKCAGRKKNQVQCGSCSEIVTFKPKQVKVHPLINPSSLPVSKSVTSSNHRDSKNLGWYQQQDDDDFNFHKLQGRDSHRQKKDFADSVSPSSTASFGRTDSQRGSNRSIQLKSVPASRSRFSDNPKDILCQGDADSQAAASVHCTVNQQGLILEDKQIDPFSSLQKDYSRSKQTRNNGHDRNRKVDCEDNFRDGKIDMKSIQKSKESHTSGPEDECHNQIDQRKDKTGSPQDTANGNKYRNKIDSNTTSSLEDKGMRKNCDHNSSFRVQVVNKKCAENADNDTLEVKSITKRCEPENIKDDKLPHSDSKRKTIASAKNESSINECTDSISCVSSGAEVDEIQSLTAKNGDSSFLAGFLKKGLKDLSLFSQPADSAKVSINGHPISERALRKAEKKAGPVSPGSYWYDYRAGFWGVFGNECSGIIPPFIKEFNYRMPKDCAGGNTGVFVNGRELHQKDFDLLVGRGLPRLSGKSYSVEISGSVIDDTTGKKLRGLGKLAPT